MFMSKLFFKDSAVIKQCYISLVSYMTESDKKKAIAEGKSIIADGSNILWQSYLCQCTAAESFIIDSC